jgi:hypothetical protein
MNYDKIENKRGVVREQDARKSGTIFKFEKEIVNGKKEVTQGSLLNVLQ